MAFGRVAAGSSLLREINGGVSYVTALVSRFRFN